MQLQSKSYEFTQFLVQVLGVRTSVRYFPHKVTYHPSCHGSRLLGVKDEPLALMEHVKDWSLCRCRLRRTAADSAARLR